MTTDIVFRDEEFSFTHDGVAYHVHTEVGNGPTRVVVDEARPEQPALEGIEE